MIGLMALFLGDVLTDRRSEPFIESERYSLGITLLVIFMMPSSVEAARVVRDRVPALQ